jgi:hypothetical protein
MQNVLLTQMSQLCLGYEGCLPAAAIPGDKFKLMAPQERKENACDSSQSHQSDAVKGLQTCLFGQVATLRTVGHGTMGEVVLVEFAPRRDEGNRIAIKQVKRQEWNLNLLREWFFLARLQSCPGVVRLVTDTRLSARNGLCFENGSAERFALKVACEYLSSAKWDNSSQFWTAKNRNLRDVLTFFYNLLKCFDALEELGVLHNDVKRQNLMWTSVSASGDGSFREVKLFDFGGAAFRNSSFYLNAMQFNQVCKGAEHGEVLAKLTLQKVQSAPSGFISERSYHKEHQLASFFVSGKDDDHSIARRNGDGPATVGGRGTPGWRYCDGSKLAKRVSKTSELHCATEGAAEAVLHEPPHSNDCFAVGHLAMMALTAGTWFEARDLCFMRKGLGTGRCGDIREAVWTKWVQDNCFSAVHRAIGLWGGAEPPAGGGKRKRKEHLHLKLTIALGECARALLCKGKSCKSVLARLVQKVGQLQEEYPNYSALLSLQPVPHCHSPATQ